MPKGTSLTHRTTVEIDVSAYRDARLALGTDGYKETVNESLRAVSRNARLQRGAALIRSGDVGLISPEELEKQRRLRHG